MSRGFTLVELAIVLAIGVVLVPIVWTMSAKMEDQVTLAQWELDVARATRTIGEELRLETRRGTARADAVGFLRPDCEVTWDVRDGILHRDVSAPCGGSRGLARNVDTLRWADGGLEVTFARRLRVDRVQRATVFFPADVP